MAHGREPIRRDGRLADRALALTVTALLLLTPPIITIFNTDRTLFGIPLLHVYCFAAWLAAIVLGGLLARRMAAGDGGPGQGGDLGRS